MRRLPIRETLQAAKVWSSSVFAGSQALTITGEVLKNERVVILLPPSVIPLCNTTFGRCRQTFPSLLPLIDVVDLTCPCLLPAAAGRRGFGARASSEGGEVGRNKPHHHHER